MDNEGALLNSSGFGGLSFNYVGAGVENIELFGC